MSETGKLGEKIVLCGANAYEQKYYFNPRFSKIPQSVQDELHIICVLFTREVGGIFTIVFEEELANMRTQLAFLNEIGGDGPIAHVGTGLTIGAGAAVKEGAKVFDSVKEGEEVC